MKAICKSLNKPEDTGNERLTSDLFPHLFRQSGEEISTSQEVQDEVKLPFSLERIVKFHHEGMIDVS